MGIVYFYRNNRCGFSIKKVFKTITLEIKKSEQIHEVILPCFRARPWDIIINGLFAYRHRSKQGINHITGDVHYLTLFLPQKSTIVTVHDVGRLYSLRGLKKKLWNLLYIQSLRRAKKVIFISEFSKNEVLKMIKLNVNQYSVIENPISSQFNFQPKKFNPKKPMILSIGTKSNKNLFRTIEALKGIECHLRIIGYLNDEILIHLEKNKIDYSNTFNLTDNEILQEYFKCDIVNFPSLFEGFGMPIIEGQAMGRIVVCSDLEPMFSVAGGAAFYADPYSIKSIREAYDSAIQKPIIRNNYIKNGLKNVKKYNISRISNKYLILYKSIQY